MSKYCHNTLMEDVFMSQETPNSDQEKDGNQGKTPAKNNPVVTWLIPITMIGFVPGMIFASPRIHVNTNYPGLLIFAAAIGLVLSIFVRGKFFTPKKPDLINLEAAGYLYLLCFGYIIGTEIASSGPPHDFVVVAVRSMAMWLIGWVGLWLGVFILNGGHKPLIDLSLLPDEILGSDCNSAEVSTKPLKN